MPRPLEPNCNTVFVQGLQIHASGSRAAAYASTTRGAWFCTRDACLSDEGWCRCRRPEDAGLFQSLSNTIGNFAGVIAVPLTASIVGYAPPPKRATCATRAAVQRVLRHFLRKLPPPPRVCSGVGCTGEHAAQRERRLALHRHTGSWDNVFWLVASAYVLSASLFLCYARADVLLKVENDCSHDKP